MMYIYIMYSSFIHAACEDHLIVAALPLERKTRIDNINISFGTFNESESSAPSYHGGTSCNELRDTRMVHQTS